MFGKKYFVLAVVAVVVSAAGLLLAIYEIIVYNIEKLQ